MIETNYSGPPLTPYNTLSQSKESDLLLWSQQLADHFPHLRAAQVYGLARWSFGMLVALGGHFQGQVNTVAGEFVSESHTV